MSEKDEELIKLLIAIRDSFASVVESINKYIASKAEIKQAPAPAKFDVKSIFPEDLRCLLKFEEGPAVWKITPRQYLGAENFARVAEIVRKHGGDYISAGKESHFIVPK